MNFNNNKNEKGITMLSLIITIFMLAIVSATVIYYSRSLSKTAKLENLKSNMLLIQAQAKIISEKINYGDTSVVLDESKSQGNGFYLLDDEDLVNMGLDEIIKNKSKGEKYYIKYPINGYTMDVQYSPGITYKGTVYKYLSQIQDAGL